MCSQLIAKLPTTGGLTSRQHTYGEAIPHLGSGHQQAACKASQLTNEAKALAVLQMMLCTLIPKGRGQALPTLALWPASSEPLWDARDGSSAIPAMLPHALAAAAQVAATSSHVQPPAPCSLNAPL